MNPKTIIEAVRAPFFTGVIIPVILGSVIAWNAGYDFNWGYFLLTLVGIICIHAGANTINDYFDHLSRNDEVNEEFVRPFSGGSRMIQKGIMSPKGMLTLSLTMYAIGCAIGIILAVTRGMPIFWIGLLGVAFGVLYVMPGINLVGRGIGEIAILIAFGVLCVMGAFYVQAQTFAWEPFILSLPVGLLILLVLFINEFPDYTADKAVGKDHLVVRLGKKVSSRLYVGLMILTYVIIVIAALVYNIWVLLGLLTIPMAVKISRNALVNYDNIKELVPSNAGTIAAHMFTGLLLSGGYVIASLI